MTSAVASDRLKAFVDLLVDSLDDLAAGAELAARADLSRYHFQRLVGAALGETPGAFRRRLLLERAAWELREGATVTEAALTAVYGWRFLVIGALRHLDADVGSGDPIKWEHLAA